MQYSFALRARPINEPRDVKLTALPMGGAGEMVRGRLKLVPSMFLTAGSGEDFDSNIDKCTAQETIATKGSSAKEVVQRVSFITRGSVVKREVSGERVVAIVSKNAETVVLVLVKRGSDGFVAEVRTADSKLTSSIANELKKQFSDQIRMNNYSVILIII